MAKKTWRSAVKQQMYEATMLQAAKSKGPNHPPFLYRWEHVSAVVAVATKLAKKVKADEDIVEAAA